MEDQPEEQNKLASFQEIPMQINPKSSRYFLSHSINQPQINHSEILTKNEFSIFSYGGLQTTLAYCLPLYQLFISFKLL